MADTKRQGWQGRRFSGWRVFKTAVYIFIIVFLIWVGKSAYQFGYDVFNQQAMSPGEGQQVTCSQRRCLQVKKLGNRHRAEGSYHDALAFTIQGKNVRISRTDQSSNIPTQYWLIHRPGSLQCCQEKRARKDRTASDRRRTHADLYNSLDMGEYPFLQELETKALSDRVPIIRRDMQSFYEDASGTETTGSAFGGGDCRRLLHTSYV